MVPLTQAISNLTTVLFITLITLKSKELMDVEDSSKRSNYTVFPSREESTGITALG